MRVTVLMENAAARPGLTAEHGLSLYVEACGRRILFDAGQTEAFADNAAALGVDLGQVDLAILSHGHYDHAGGLQRFLRENDHAPVYVHRDAFEPHWHGTEKDIGVDPALENSARVVKVSGQVDLGCGMTLTDCNRLPMAWPPAFGGLQVKRNGQLLADDFRHEQYLLIREEERLIALSGCSHKGAMNILEWLAPDVLIGGFHFVKLDPSGDELAAAARELARRSCLCYTGHCTGDAQFAVLKASLGDRLQALHGGMVFEI